MGTQASVSSAALAHDVRLAVTRTLRRLRRVGSAEAQMLTMTQLSAVATIGAAGELTLGELAARERVQPPSMTRVVAALVEMDLVERRADPADGRQVLVTLSTLGETVLDAEIHAREAWLSTELDKLSARDREIVRTASEILIRIADQ